MPEVQLLLLIWFLFLEHCVPSTVQSAFYTLVHFIRETTLREVPF